MNIIVCSPGERDRYEEIFPDITFNSYRIHCVGGSRRNPFSWNCSWILDKHKPVTFTRLMGIGNFLNSTKQTDFFIFGLADNEK